MIRKTPQNMRFLEFSVAPPRLTPPLWRRADCWPAAAGKSGATPKRGHIVRLANPASPFGALLANASVIRPDRLAPIHRTVKRAAACAGWLCIA
jgi:hypothetical protein